MTLKSRESPMIDSAIRPNQTLDDTVRQFVFEQSAATGAVPQAAEISNRLSVLAEDVAEALKRLAASKVLILAPNNGDIWAANPFCAVPSGFRVQARDIRYWGICAWDALGIVAAIGASDASVTAPCADCGERLHLEFSGGELTRSEGLIHFAVPAREWWKNIGFA